MKKFTIIAAIVGFFLGVAGVVAYGSVHGSYTTYKIDKTKTINAKEINNIQFDSSITGVRVYPTNSDKITVHLHGGTSRKNIELTAKADGNTANIEVGDQNKLKVNFFPFEFVGNYLTAELELPEKMYEHIRVNSTAGSIKMEKITANQFEIDSSAGSIHIENTKGDIAAHTSAGSMKLINTEGALDLKDSAGSIEVQLKSILHNIKAKSSAGSVQVITEEEPNALQMNLRTTAGSVHMDFSGAAFTTKEHDNVIGTIGKGGPLVQLESSAGSVSMKKK